MGDVFNEQIVRRRATAADGLKKAGLALAAVAVFLLAQALLPGFALFVGAGAGFAAFYAAGFIDVEYEYAFTNGELDIDVIYSKSRRKRLLTAAAKDFELFAHIQDEAHANAFLGAQDVLSCHSGEAGPDTYAFLAVIKGRRTKVVIEPNEKMLRAVRQAMSRNKFHLRPGMVLV